MRIYKAGASVSLAAALIVGGALGVAQPSLETEEIEVVEPAEKQSVEEPAEEPAEELEEDVVEGRYLRAVLCSGD